jgi:hypothetical protein
VRITGTDRQEDLTDVDASNGSVGLTPSTTHTSLKPIRPGTGQHLVDTDDVERVGTTATVRIHHSNHHHEEAMQSYRILKWKPSFPAILTRYLLAQIRAASRALRRRKINKSHPTDFPPGGWQTNLRRELLVLVGHKVDA